MEVEELERRLNEEAGSAIVYSTDSENYVGSIWVHKRSMGPLLLEDFTPQSELYKKILAKKFRGSLVLEDLSPAFTLHKRLLKTSKKYPNDYKNLVERRRDTEERWIEVLIREVDRAHYIGPDYIDEEEDCRKDDLYYFRSILEVQELLNSLGFSIADLEPMD